MASVLFLPQRIPYPPNKGDKLRSYHFLQHLRQTHRVFVGTFLDDADDEVHVPALAELCEGLYIARLGATRARLRCLLALSRQQPLTLAYFHDAGLTDWVAQTVRKHSIDSVVVFSSSMAPYALAIEGLPMVVDFVDVDSDKWDQYARRRRWPMSWLYRREARLLAAFERHVAARARRSFFVSSREVELFSRDAPELAGRIEALCNGVDAEYFEPRSERQSPYAPNVRAIVFTGTMDHWPNVDAVLWFSREVMPRVRAQWPEARLYVVGRRPTAEVAALASQSVTVTGTVDDVRPYVQHAAVVVAPMRISRGIQNKILEAMAMGRPVVGARTCIEAIEAHDGVEAMAADGDDSYVRAITELLARPVDAASMGAAARQFILKAYRWPNHLRQLDPYLDLPGRPELRA